MSAGEKQPPEIQLCISTIVYIKYSNQINIIAAQRGLSSKVLSHLCDYCFTGVLMCWGVDSDVYVKLVHFGTYSSTSSVNIFWLTVCWTVWHCRHVPSCWNMCWLLQSTVKSQTAALIIPVLFYYWNLNTFTIWGGLKWWNWRECTCWLHAGVICNI